jgi:hypothetical protein
VGSTWISKLEPLSVFTETFISATPPLLPHLAAAAPAELERVGGGFCFPLFCASSFLFRPGTEGAFWQVSPRGLANLYFWCYFCKVSKSVRILWCWRRRESCSWTLTDRRCLSCTCSACLYSIYLWATMAFDAGALSLQHDQAHSFQVGLRRRPSFTTHVGHEPIISSMWPKKCHFSPKLGASNFTAHEGLIWKDIFIPHFNKYVLYAFVYDSNFLSYLKWLD